MEKYQIISLIGEGAYGIVLKARNISSNQLVAIKQFKESQNDENIKKIIHRQIQVLKSLKHPNIVELKQVFKKKGIYYLVFEYLDHNILEVLESSNLGLERTLIAQYIYQILLGLSFMHSNNHIHRDIKPQNLLVNSSHLLRICDMGFARKISQKQILTDYVATRWYRSPELLLKLNYSFPADIWATGCLMCQLIDGNPLFPGQDQIDQIHKIEQFFNIDLQRYMDDVNRVHHRTHQTNGRQNLKSKYFYKVSGNGINLLRKMLEIDPEKRITARQSLTHPFFDSVRHLYFGKDKILQNGSFFCVRQNQKSVKADPTNLINLQKSNKTQYGSFRQSIFQIKERYKFNLKNNLKSLNSQRYNFGQHISKSVPTDIPIQYQKPLSVMKGINQIYGKKIEHLANKENQNLVISNKVKNFRKKIMKY